MNAGTKLSERACWAICVVIAIGVQAWAQAATGTVSHLSAVYRHGQVFLTWQERDVPAGTTLNVYVHREPITPGTLGKATKIGHHVEPHSARDWWQDPASYDAKAKPGKPVGFRIATGEPLLDPRGGLFVHTVTPHDAGAACYAVTTSDAKGVEHTALRLGENSLGKPVTGRLAPTQAIWLGTGKPPAEGAGRGKSLVLSLHGRGGGRTAGPRSGTVNCLGFGNARQGWREGLAFKFRLTLSTEAVRITPSGRAWTGGRPVLESRDRRDHCPAVNTWWYGYHSRIYDTTLTPKAVVPNYTEEQLLWMVRWAQSHLGTDPARTYLTGGSMGGSGTVSMVMHHPGVFAAAVATVPIVSYTRPGKGSARRLECICGPLSRPAVTHQGVPLLEHMNGALGAARAKADLPPLFITHGRRDGSIPWENNPPFYRAMNAARQALYVHWNNGTHPTSHRTAPADVKAWSRQFTRYALDRSFPVFTNCSDNRDPGNGDPTDGDIVGWMNRGLGWRDLVDTPSEYALTVTAAYPGLGLPVTVDVTPRRVQRFRVKPGDEVTAQVGDAPARKLRVDGRGLVTVCGVKIADARGTRVRLSR